MPRLACLASLLLAIVPTALCAAEKRPNILFALRTENTPARQAKKKGR